MVFEVFGSFGSPHDVAVDRIVVCPSPPKYHREGSSRTWGLAGAHGGPRQSASFRILPRALLFAFGLTPLSPPTASHGRKGPHGQIKISSLTDCDSLSGNDNVATLT